MKCFLFAVAILFLFNHACKNTSKNQPPYCLLFFYQNNNFLAFEGGVQFLVHKHQWLSESEFVLFGFERLFG
jgi:hypothetical protein